MPNLLPQKKTEQRIHLLDILLANQIAAGEVIERPASVVKELVENSLDAGATSIEIDILKGGLQFIRIRDNGFGIHPEDLPLAVSRHATSKLTALSDFEELLSLGFRGEALASICAVSRFSIISAIEGQPTGWQLSVEGSEASPQLLPAAHLRGTTVEIRDLFFNTPARRKFLRSEQTEWQHIVELVKRLALSHFEVGFHLTHQDKTILQLRAADTEDMRARRVQAVCGAAFIQQANYVEFAAYDMTLLGWVGDPKFAPTLPNPQFFYLNGRMVRDKLLNHAVRQAFEGYLPEGRHPVYILYLTIKPGMVDVNVHPTKHEVRFRESRLVHDFIFTRLRQLVVPGGEYPLVEESFSGKQSVGGHGLQVAEQIAVYKNLHGASDKPRVDEEPKMVGRFLAQLHLRYLLVELPTGLGIIDIQKASHAFAYQQLTHSREKMVSQPLLIPVTVAITALEAECIEVKQPFLQRYGIEMCVLGPQQLIVRGLPAILRNADVPRLVTDVLAFLKEGDDPDSFCSLLASYPFMPARQLTVSEINQLLTYLYDNSATQKKCLQTIYLEK